MQVITGSLKEYDWGPVDGLARWFGARTGGPQAELWFGTHVNGPSPIVGADTSLDARMDAAPVLVKLLSAAHPLSVQVHPTTAVAQAQWLRQQHGAEVVYSDANEKAELLIALEPFHAFAGWRDPDQVHLMLQAIDGTAPAASALGSGDVIGAIRVLLELGSSADIATLVARLPEAAAAAGLPERSRAAYRLVAATFPSDRGALLTCLLDDLVLGRGEGLFVPAGVPHSYLSGLAIEVMTASDNVVRLGLTSKPVFVEHALEALVLDAEPTRYPDTGTTVATPPGFDVTLIDDTSCEVPHGRYRLVLCIDGALEAACGEQQVHVRQGQAVVLTADEPDLGLRIDGFAAVVTASAA